MLRVQGPDASVLCSCTGLAAMQPGVKAAVSLLSVVLRLTAVSPPSQLLSSLLGLVIHCCQELRGDVSPVSQTCGSGSGVPQPGSSVATLQAQPQLRMGQEQPQEEPGTALPETPWQEPCLWCSSWLR